MLEKAIFCKLFLRDHPLLVSTLYSPLEQSLSQLHVNYVPYFCLQAIPYSFEFHSSFPFLETWPFSQCIHECKHIIISLWNISACSCLERFMSEICAWDIESRKETKAKRKWGREAFLWAGREDLEELKWVLTHGQGRGSQLSDRDGQGWRYHQGQDIFI